jgi:hypothetical protein
MHVQTRTVVQTSTSGTRASSYSNEYKYSEYVTNSSSRNRGNRHVGINLQQN